MTPSTSLCERYHLIINQLVYFDIDYHSDISFFYNKMQKHVSLTLTLQTFSWLSGAFERNMRTGEWRWINRGYEFGWQQETAQWTRDGKGQMVPGPRGSWSVRGHGGKCGGGENWKGDVILDPRFNAGAAAGSQECGGLTPQNFDGQHSGMMADPGTGMQPIPSPPKQPPPGINVRPPGPPDTVPPFGPADTGPSTRPRTPPRRAEDTGPSTRPRTPPRRAEDEAAEARAAQKAKAAPPGLSAKWITWCVFHFEVSMMERKSKWTYWTSQKSPRFAWDKKRAMWPSSHCYSVTIPWHSPLKSITFSLNWGSGNMPVNIFHDRHCEGLDQSHMRRLDPAGLQRTGHWAGRHQGSLETRGEVFGPSMADPTECP